MNQLLDDLFAFHGSPFQPLIRLGEMDPFMNSMFDHPIGAQAHPFQPHIRLNGLQDLSRPMGIPMPKPLTPTPDSRCCCGDTKDRGEQRRRFRSYGDEDERTVNIPKIQAVNKMPPNWERNIKQTLKEQLTYRTFRVFSTSAEYSSIAALLDPLSITSVERIANPTLWKQFDQKRKDMIKSKCDDVQVLLDIGLDKKEVKDVLQYSKDFQLHPTVARVPFNDNMSLLFHCTRNAENIDSILKTGLDERIGNRGYLGRGIYFTDNPKKSMAYDGCGVMFICAVLLGDCMSMDHDRVTDLVREPTKLNGQQRNFNDLFFDSIVGRPGGNDNEFVIYNRQQCIPLYMVKYKNMTRYALDPHQRCYGSGDFMRARNEFPSFCWMSMDGKRPMPNLTRMKTIDWPFYSNKIFEKL